SDRRSSADPYSGPYRRGSSTRTRASAARHHSSHEAGPAAAQCRQASAMASSLLFVSNVNRNFRPLSGAGRDPAHQKLAGFGEIAELYVRQTLLPATSRQRAFRENEIGAPGNTVIRPAIADDDAGIGT